MSRVPGKRLGGSASTVVSEQPRALLDNVATLAPSLGSLSALRNGGSAATAAAAVGNTLAERTVDTLTSNPYGQLGVRAFTEGIYTDDGHLKPALSDAMTEGTGRLVSDMLGEETVAKMEQRYAKAVDKVTDIELSAGQIAMAGRSLDHLTGDEAEVPAVVDVPAVGEMPDAFSTALLEPEVDVVAKDLYELDAEQLGRIAGTAATAGYIPQMEVPDGGAADVETDGCCVCCGDDAGGDDELCGCDCCGCGDCCDCGDCFGCGDCIGCGDCPDCCSCSIM